MCYSQLKIDNPSLSYTLGQPRKVIIPCNTCESCRRIRQNDWFVRSWYEFQRYKVYGRVFTAVLTYNEQNLPHFEDKRDYQYYTREDGTISTRESKVNFSCVCFSMEDLTDFRKRFRVYTERITHCNPKEIKFLITCEFGEDTHRPHYHILVFVPWKMKVSEFEAVLAKSWKRGFFGCSKKKGYIVNSCHGIRYVTKYICKDLFYEDEQIKNYLSKDTIDPAEYEFRMDNIRDCLPRFRSSEKFGTGLETEIKNMKDPLNYLLSDKPVSIPFGQKKTLHFDIPKYIKQRLFKIKDTLMSDYLGRPIFHYSSLGEHYMKEKAVLSFKRDISNLEQLSNTDYCLDSIKYGTAFDKRGEVYARMLSKALQNVDVKKLSFYRNYLRYTPDIWQFKNCDDYFNNCAEIVERAFDHDVIIPEFDDLLLDHRAFDEDSLTRRSTPINENQWIRKTVCLSDLYIFRHYEHVCNILDTYNLILSNSRKFIYKRKERKRKEIKLKYKSYQQKESL